MQEGHNTGRPGISIEDSGTSAIHCSNYPPRHPNKYKEIQTLKSKEMKTIGIQYLQPDRLMIVRVLVKTLIVRSIVDLSMKTSTRQGKLVYD